MTNEDLRDTLAIEIAKITLTNYSERNVASLNDICEAMSYTYRLADAVLSRRNVSAPADALSVDDSYFSRIEQIILEHPECKAAGEFLKTKYCSKPVITKCEETK